MTMKARHAQRGLTLLELILVMAIAGILAATLTVFLRPAIESFSAVRQRAALVDAADSALRLMVREVRSAVPNSIRSPDANCFELVPTRSGGRFRRERDTSEDPAACPDGCSAPLDTTTVTSRFDVLSELSATPAVGDYVVVNNQDGNDVYSGTNRSAITAVGSAGSFGRLRLTIDPQQFSPGYDGARFVVVPASEQAVFYVCRGADGTLDADGNGRGTLVRLRAYGFNAAAPASCPAGAGAVVATQVQSCRFIFDPNQGATQQSGFVALQLSLARGGEVATLNLGAHVSNVP